MVAADDEQRPVAQDRHPAGPERAARQVGRPPDRGEALWVDPLDPSRNRVRQRAPPESVAQHVDLAGIAQHDHRRAERIAHGGHLEPLAGRDPERGERTCGGRAPRSGVLGRPRSRPEAGVPGQEPGKSVRVQIVHTVSSTRSGSVPSGRPSESSR